MRWHPTLVARLRALLGPDVAGVRQSFVALGLVDPAGGTAAAVRAAEDRESSEEQVSL